MSEAAGQPAAAADDPLSRQVLEALDGLEDRPVVEHVAVLEEVNRSIADELAALDEV